MKLLCLGTSHGVPAEDRFTSCYVLEVGEKLYIFDAGAPVTNLLLRQGRRLENIKAFFLSHFHGDHIDGGVSLLTLCDWYFKETDFDVFLPDALSERTIRTYGEACDDVTFADGRIRLHVGQPGVLFDDGTVRVTAIPTEHMTRADKRAYGFFVEAEGKKFLYTGDLSYGLKKKDFPEIAFRERFDLILSEGAHFPLEALQGCMERVDTAVFAVGHVFPPERFDQLAALQGAYPFRLTVPADGDVIEF